MRTMPVKVCSKKSRHKGRKFKSQKVADQQSPQHRQLINKPMQKSANNSEEKKGAEGDDDVIRHLGGN